MRTSVASIIVLLAVAGPCVAASMPDLKVARTCRDAQGADVFDAGASSARKPSKEEVKKAYDTCIKSEMDARLKAAAVWPRVKASDRTVCTELSQSFYPSYVELAICLAMYDPRAEFGGLDKQPVGTIPNASAPAAKIRQPRQQPQ